jgi:hypothetical protein
MANRPRGVDLCARRQGQGRRDGAGQCRIYPTSWKTHARKLDFRFTEFSEIPGRARPVSARRVSSSPPQHSSAGASMGAHWTGGYNASVLSPLLALIQRSAWNKNSPKFAFWDFSEVRFNGVLGSSLPTSTKSVSNNSTLGGMRPVPDGCYTECTTTRSVEALKPAPKVGA